MLYHSTRSEAHFVDSAEAVLEGLAPDGGLYMPESIPAFDWQACLPGQLYGNVRENSCRPAAGYSRYGYAGSPRLSGEI